MAEEQKKPKDLGKLLNLGLLAINFLVIGIGGYLVYVSTLGYQSPYITEKELNKEIQQFRESLHGDPVIYSMDTFNTNLDGIPRRFIRVKLNVEMLDEEGFEEVMTIGAEARDAVVKILNSKTFGEVETVQGKLHLKNQIIAQLNTILHRGVVRNIYFTEFAVQ